jgi:hypothetical protein
MQLYNSQNGQSFSDVCLNTYGTMDTYIKMLKDNNLTPAAVPVSSQVVSWDENLLVDQTVYSSNKKKGIIFSTMFGINNNSFYQVISPSNPTFYPTNPIPITPNSGSMYMQPLSTYYTATGGESYIILNALIGCNIVQIEREIKPMLPSEFTFDSATGKISFTSAVLSGGETIFLIYSKTIIV